MDEPVKEEPKLIFTCPKTDIYAIKLEKKSKNSIFSKKK